MVPHALPAAHLVAVPSNAGCRAALGLRRGPDLILQQISAARRNVTRLSEEQFDTADPLEIAHRVAPVVARVVQAHQVPLVLGGDHTVALGSILGVRAGLRRRHRRSVPLFLLWLDAHPDVNAPETSPSGNLHGMVLAGLLGHGPLAIQPPLRPEHVVIAGARAFDPGELAFLGARPEIAFWDVSALLGRGWRPLADELLARVRRARGRLYVSLDLDVLDPRHAPGVAVPAPRGALPTPLLSLLRHLAASRLLAGADVVELNPPADRAGRTVRLAARAVRALGSLPALGSRARTAPAEAPAAGSNSVPAAA